MTQVNLPNRGSEEGVERVKPFEVLKNNLKVAGSRLKAVPVDSYRETGPV